MATTVRVAIIGASGYTGSELLRLLSQHPKVSITRIVASEKSQGAPVSTILPHLSHVFSDEFSALDTRAISQDSDLVFLALPHTTSLQPVAEFLTEGKIVIDLSADYRLNDAHVYEQWYGLPHTHPELLDKTTYGLPELHRQDIQHTQFVAVPGCYPTAAILQLAPLVKGNLLEPSPIIIDAKSGISGAGRTPAPGYHFPEAHEAIHAYKITAHRHLPEIEQELHGLSQEQSSSPSIIFTPHLLPINRGILSTAYVKLKSGVDQKTLDQAYQDLYRDEYFIRVKSGPEQVNPNTLRGSNFFDVSGLVDTNTGYLITTGALDNLVKGAAGQAIQCMNLMLGFEEQSGLTAPGIFP